MTVPHLVEVLGKSIARETGLDRILIVLSADWPLARVRNEIDDFLKRLQVAKDLEIEIKLVSDSDVDMRAADTIRRVAAMPNPYPGRSRSTVVNTVRYLQLLKDSMPLINENLSETFFCRSDLLVLGEARLNVSGRPFCCRVRTPSWHRWSGINDRFAFVPSEYVGAYFNRFDKIHSYLDDGNLLHGESFLQASLAGVPHDSDLEVALMRTRTGGVIVKEDFRSDSVKGRVLRHLGLKGPNPSVVGAKSIVD